MTDQLAPRYEGTEPFPDVNLLCHVVGARPFTTRRYDRAISLWPLALLSLGESWHNMHHSDPTCARHGADPWQIDISAVVIRIFERLGWATGVRWPVLARLDDRRRSPGCHGTMS
jgi:stearoyl-CoA desaturase (delta-9 desaturase)